LRNDYGNWNPLSVQEITTLFSEIPVFWGIAGGWGLDLHLGKKTREHSDIDIVVKHNELLSVYHYLAKDWLLYKAHGGKLELWKQQDSLAEINNIWACRDTGSPFAYQIMAIDFKEGDWVYRREPAVRRRDILLKNEDGIPYLRPEIQLLYKGGASQVREKDLHDFHTMIPFLSVEEKQWLRTSLMKQFPEGHAWLKWI
jgi:hypothetical protein